MWTVSEEKKKRFKRKGSECDTARQELSSGKNEWTGLGEEKRLRGRKEERGVVEFVVLWLPRHCFYIPGENTHNTASGALGCAE
jgi:hypothetical protein